MNILADEKIAQFRRREERIRETEDGLRMLNDDLAAAIREDRRDWAEMTEALRSLLTAYLMELNRQTDKIANWLDRETPGWRR
jgi:hypothetical protein